MIFLLDAQKTYTDHTHSEQFQTFLDVHIQFRVKFNGVKKKRNNTFTLLVFRNKFRHRSVA